jgi:hypothetical protein
MNEQKIKVQKMMAARRREIRADDKRDYPKFNPACMLTSDYVTAYTALNHAHLRLAPCAFEPAVNRTPVGYDPQFPVCVEEPNE